MSSKYEGRSSHYELIDDIIESPSPTLLRKSQPNRSYSNYSSLPSSLNKTEQTSLKRTIEVRDRLNATLPRSNSSLLMMSNDQRRKEIDQIIKNLYDGKLMTTFHDENSEPMPNKNEKENKNTVENLDLISLDGDFSTLQRELQEKELDIIHLRKEIQELQVETKLLKSKSPTVRSNGHSTNNQEIDALRREKDILQNELRASQELVGKLQQNAVINRSTKIDQMSGHQKEALEKKLKTYEKQIRVLTNENEKSKRNSIQIEGVIGQLKRENEELQQKLNETKKRNDELFYQEFNALRNDLKMLKQRNDELFDENVRLQQRPHLDFKHLKVDRSVSPNISEASDSTNYLTSVSVEHYNNRRSVAINGSSPHRPIRYNSSIGQDDINRSRPKPIDQQFRSSKSKRGVVWDEENIHSNEDISKYDDPRQIPDDSKPQYHQSNYPVHRSTTLNESTHHSRQMLNHENSQDGIERRPMRRHTDTISPRRPFAPLSVSDIHINDVIKFSRPGGKISKGVVKYIGILPDKSDQYLGLELEDEESKHDGIYQDQRLFQCKPNRGVFVAFNKVIMAWSDR